MRQGGAAAARPGRKSEEVKNKDIKKYVFRIKLEIKDLL